MASIFQQIKNFNKRHLKDVVTVEKQIVEIKAETPKKPKGHYSYHMSHTDEEDSIEWFEEPNKLRQKCKKLAEMIKKSKRVVIYTGAGISTSAKLPDYRGGDGMWTVKDKGTNHTRDYTTISDALPTLAHFAIAELISRDLVQFVVSTNVDGLHMRSGLVRGENLSELHGNSYLEVCNKCGKEYLRAKDVLRNQTEDHRVVNRHWCGARCEVEGCDGLLLDTIVAFGENLPTDQLELAINESKKGDLAIILGSTMMVQPACILPSYICENGGKMVICNLQNTPYDHDAHFLIHAYIDDIFFLLLNELNIPIADELTLYDGYRISSSLLNYKFKADDEYPEKLRCAKEAQVRIRREKEENKPSGNAITRGENPYKKSTISNLHNQHSTLHFPTLELAFFSNCSSCEFHINDKTKKIVIENCTNIRLYVNEKVITNVLEIINSSDLSIHLNTPVYTITCDNSKNINLEYGDREYFQMIAWAKIENVSLRVADQQVDLSIFDRINSQQDQVITKLENNEILSSITQRDSCGRITQLVVQ